MKKYRIILLISLITVLITGCQTDLHVEENCNDIDCSYGCNWTTITENRDVLGKIVNKEYIPETTKNVPGMAGKVVIMTKKTVPESYITEIGYKNKIIVTDCKSIYDNYNVGDVIKCTAKIKMKKYKNNIEKEKVIRLKIK